MQRLSLLVLTLVATLVLCSPQLTTAQEKAAYQSSDLIIKKISEHAYEHTSYLQTQDFGKVPCNGMIVVNQNEAIVFDTPANDKASEELINWLKSKLACKIKAVIPTHFHEDCLGGLTVFHRHHIPSYANNLTIKLAKEHGAVLPQNGFDKKLEFRLGDKKVLAEFIGEGHTKDNIVGYFPADKILFGGCLVKEVGATKGYLADANVKAWPLTVWEVKEQFPNAQLVIPGHGKAGGTELLDYTISLFQKNE